MAVTGRGWEGVVWIGVVIRIAEWIGKGTILGGVCGVEEEYDAVHSDVDCALRVVGGEVLCGEGCGEERYAGRGGDARGERLLLGGASGDGAEGEADMVGAEGVSAAEGYGCGEDGRLGAERAVE